MSNITPTAGIVMTSSEAVQVFNAAEFKYTRQVSKGLSASINYTFMHDMSDNMSEGGENDYEDLLRIRQYDYGNDENEIRSRIAGGVSYTLPFGKTSHGLAREAIGGWQLNALGRWQTGGVFSVSNSARLPGLETAYINNGISGSDRPDMVAGQGPFSNVPAGLFFNPAAYTQHAIGVQGDTRGNALHGPHYRSLDLGLNKEFQIYERLALRFRAEVFNITNTPTFSNPGGDINSGSVGQLNGTLGTTNPRQIQGSLKFVF